MSNNNQHINVDAQDINGQWVCVEKQNGSGWRADNFEEITLTGFTENVLYLISFVLFPYFWQNSFDVVSA